MDLKDLLSGIGVVIDDALGNDGDPNDSVLNIVERLEQDLSLPFYKIDRLPPKDHWPNLFQSASFILLDWKLWRASASQLVQEGIAANIRFLEQAKSHFVPVFIFTNESVADVTDALPSDIYRAEEAENSFVFVHSKIQLLSGNSLDLEPVHKWTMQSASVYALKTWDRVFFAARRSLFGDMYGISPHWPRIFWSAYQEDGVDPSLGLTQLITDGLVGRIGTGAFTRAALGNPGTDNKDVPADDLRALIGATTFRAAGTDDDIRCGDLFKLPKGKYLLNIRADCDCVPRDGLKRDDVELYCIKGEKMRESEVSHAYEGGHFRERPDQSIVFAATDGKSIRFRFKNLRVNAFGKLKEKRIGRLLHPYLTRIQQRYALYLQRQGLPSVPTGAVSTYFVDSAR